MTVQDYLSTLCRHLGLLEDQFSIEVDEDDGAISAKINLPETESGLFIGFHGETLQALQKVIKISFFEELGEKFLKLNVNNYREQRLDQLIEKIKNLASQVLETKQPRVLFHLTSHDRYLVHSLIASEKEFAGLTTFSDGEGRDRRLTVALKTPVEDGDGKVKDGVLVNQN